MKHKNTLLLVFNKSVYLKSVSDQRVRVAHTHILSHFHDDNNGNPGTQRRQKQSLCASLRDGPFTSIISFNSLQVRLYFYPIFLIKG